MPEQSFSPEFKAEGIYLLFSGDTSCSQRFALPPSILAELKKNLDSLPNNCAITADNLPHKLIPGGFPGGFLSLPGFDRPAEFFNSGGGNWYVHYSFPVEDRPERQVGIQISFALNPHSRHSWNKLTNLKIRSDAKLALFDKLDWSGENEKIADKDLASLAKRYLEARNAHAIVFEHQNSPYLNFAPVANAPEIVRDLSKLLKEVEPEQIIELCKLRDGLYVRGIPFRARKAVDYEYNRLQNEIISEIMLSKS